jgi:pyruvate kinase
MQNFHFPRIIATLWPSLAKETMLSKVVNFVDIFMVNLSYGFDEMKRKYIDTILKLDNSKTIVMQVQWSEISLKNTKAVNAKKDKILIIDFSNNHEEDTETIFIDYDNISDIPVDTIITFDNKIRVKVIKNLEDYIEVTVINGGKIEPGATIDRW